MSNIYFNQEELKSFSFYLCSRLSFLFLIVVHTISLKALEQPMDGSDADLNSLIVNFENEMGVRSQRLMELQRLVDGNNRCVSTCISHMNACI